MAAPALINVFQGLPWHGRVGAHAIDGEIVIEAEGNANDIRMAAHTDGFQPWTSFLPSRGQLTLCDGPLVNAISDPDQCAAGLGQLDLVRSQSGRPCFNAPEAVRRSARHRISEMDLKLERIAVPRVIRLDADDRRNWTRQLRDSGFGYPVLVRAAGSHDGNTVRCGDEAAARKAMSKLAKRVSAYVTEFAEFAVDERYSKLRLAFVSGEIIPRHCLQSEHWNIHARPRTAEDVESELAYLDLIGEQIRSGEFSDVARIADALALDYFGLDLGVMEKGRFVLFEANASMRILDTTASHAERFADRVRAIGSALTATLVEPAGWRDRRPLREASQPFG